MFKLFDEDGNGNISIDELLNMMAFFIELGMDTGNVDMAKTMAEVFSLGDINRDDKLSRVEFVQGMKSHPVMSKILSMKTIDALLETFWNKRFFYVVVHQYKSKYKPLIPDNIISFNYVYNGCLAGQDSDKF